MRNKLFFFFVPHSRAFTHPHYKIARKDPPRRYKTEILVFTGFWAHYLYKGYSINNSDSGSTVILIPRPIAKNNNSLTF